MGGFAASEDATGILELCRLTKGVTLWPYASVNGYCMLPANSSVPI